MKLLDPIVLRGADVLDGTGGPARKVDILIQGSRILALGNPLEVPANSREVRLDGYFVSPGWIDLHTHVFSGYGLFSVEPQDIGLHHGVTTLVDAGSAGALNFELFERGVIRAARETILAYVNIASTGLPHGHAGVQGFVGDHLHGAQHSVALAESLLNHYPDSIVGWKARLTAVLAQNDPELERHALTSLLQLRDATKRPVMVHHIESSIPAATLLTSLTAGDVYTHLYHGRGSTIFDKETGQPSPEALSARKRGVLFDVGHGSGAFQWETAEKACQQFEFWPDTISTDLHQYNLFSPVRDLATTMTKFLHLGLPLERVIAMVTGMAAMALGHRWGRGLIGEKASSDLTIFAVRKGTFSLMDAAGQVRVAGESILPMATIKDGNITACYGFYQLAEGDNSLGSVLQVAC